MSPVLFNMFFAAAAIYLFLVRLNEVEGIGRELVHLSSGGCVGRKEVPLVFGERAKGSVGHAVRRGRRICLEASEGTCKTDASLS